MKNIFYPNRRIASYTLFLSLFALDECANLWCYLDPRCNKDEINTFALKTTSLPDIPEDTDFGQTVEDINEGDSSENLSEEVLQLTASSTYGDSLEVTQEKTGVNHPNNMASLKNMANPLLPNIHIGIGLSYFSGGYPNDKNSPLTGFSIGLRWQIPLGDRVKFEPGIQYRTLGSKTIQESIVDDPYYYHVYRFEDIIRLNYLDLQPFISYAITPRWSIMGGPTVSYLLGAKATSKSEHSSNSSRSTAGLNRWNIGGSIQTIYHTENSFFALGLIFDNGFSNIYSGEEYVPGGMDKKYSNSLLLVVGYKLPLGNSNYKLRKSTTSTPEETRRNIEERKRRSEESRKAPKSSKRLR